MLAFLLGVVLGNVLLGIQIDGNHNYTGSGFFEFLNPYALLTGFTTLSLFMMHGAIYLLLKTEGRLYIKIRFLLKKAMIFFMLSFGVTTLYTLLFIPHLSDDFKSNPILFIIPVLTFLSIANVPRLAHKKKFRTAFLFSSLTISLMMVLVAVELYPVLLHSTIDPSYQITVYNAASSTKSLRIMLTIAAIGAPLVLGYTFFVYRTFRGKVQLDETSY
jgi:cytochrome d ubiquinol oxidase subunit II